MSKPRTRSLTRLSLALGLAALLLAPGNSPARAGEGGTNELETRTANEDMAALQFYRTSLNKLAVLCKQKENTSEESIYLFRIAEAQYKVAALSFRLAHSTPAAREGHPDLREYHTTLDQLAKLASKISTKYPRHPNIARAIYLRAQAYKELEKDMESTRDFRYLIDNFPQNEDMVSAQIAIYDLLSKARDYKTAIMYLKRYQVPRTENYFPVSLDHLAFANFAINDIPEALKYLEQELAVFPPQEIGNGNGGYSEREKILTNAALFYYTGLEAKLPRYTVADAITYFKRLQPGPIMTKMVSHFSNLLRSKGRDDDLEVFKKSVVAAGLGAPEITEVLLASIDTALNKRRFDRLKESADELANVITKLTPEQKKAGKSEKLAKTLGEAASNLNATFLKVKDTPDATRVSPVLVSLYSLMLKIADSDSARQKIEFNMAEIFLGLKRYEAAALHYRWIAELRPPADKEGQKLQVLARFKSLTARYEALSEQKIFPKELAAKSFKGSPEVPLAKEATQWIEWIDQYEKSPHEEPADSFAFEASRLLYMSGRVEEAINHLRTMAKNYPKSSHTISASSLILDTYLASEKWEDANQMATEFLKTADPSKPDYRNRLMDVAADSYFKTVEVLYKKQAFKDALARAESFLKLYPASKRRQNVLVLAGNAALALKDKTRALAYFAPLMKEGTATPETQGTILLTTAAVSEEKYDFDGALAAYKQYLALPPKNQALAPADIKNLKVKTLNFAWLSGRMEFLRNTLNTPTICSTDLSDHCDRFSALLGLMDPARASDKNATNRAWDRATKGVGTGRAAWAALALENTRGVSFNNRFKLLEIVATDWDKLEPLARFAILPGLSVSIPGALRQAAAEVRSMSRLKLEKADLDKRTNLIQRLELGVNKVLELPWQRIRASAMGELANSYADFAKDLTALPAPAGLGAEDLKAYNQTIAELKSPFQKKADDLRKQAIDAASEAGVEAETIVPIAVAYYSEHPAEAGQPKMIFSQLKGPVAGLWLLDGIKAPAGLNALAANAVRLGNWGLLAYAVQDAKEKNFLNEAQISAARGISLSLAGAQAEALGELKEAAPKLDKAGKQYLLGAIATAYASARAKEHGKIAIEEFVSATNESARKAVLKTEFAAEVTEGIIWSGAAVSDNTREELAALGGRTRAPASQPKGK